MEFWKLGATSRARLALAALFLAPLGNLYAAACTNPVGNEGEQIYSGNYHVMMYCNGTAWMAMGAPTISVGGTTSPSYYAVQNVPVPIQNVSTGTIISTTTHNGYYASFTTASMGAAGVGSFNATSVNVGGTMNATSITLAGAPLMPTGVIWAFDLTSCPTGWSEYTAARGRFLRGIDNGAGNDPAGTRAPGNTQADDFKSHTHHLHTMDPGIAGSVNDAAFLMQGNQARQAMDPYTDPTGGAETRPKNVAVLYCRKN